MNAFPLFFSVFVIVLILLIVITLIVQGEDGGRKTVLIVFATPALVAGVVAFMNLRAEEKVICTVTGIDRVRREIFTQDCGVLEISKRDVDIELIPLEAASILTIRGTDCIGKIVSDVSPVL